MSATLEYSFFVSNWIWIVLYGNCYSISYLCFYLLFVFFLYLLLFFLWNLPYSTRKKSLPDYLIRPDTRKRHQSYTNHINRRRGHLKKKKICYTIEFDTGQYEYFGYWPIKCSFFTLANVPPTRYFLFFIFGVIFWDTWQCLVSVFPPILPPCSADFSTCSPVLSKPVRTCSTIYCTLFARLSMRFSFARRWFRLSSLHLDIVVRLEKLRQSFALCSGEIGGSGEIARSGSGKPILLCKM